MLRLAYKRLVINNSYHSHIKGDRILVVFIVKQTFIIVFNIFIVRELAHIEFCEHIFVFKSLYHIIGRNNYIIGNTAVFKLGIHCFIAFKG